MDKAYYLPKPISRFDDHALIYLNFFDLKSRKLENLGSGSDLELRNPVILDTIPYVQSQYGEEFPPLPVFDGVACNDDHSTMRFTSTNSNMRFSTPYNSDWLSETSINFWFKISDWSQIGRD